MAEGIGKVCNNPSLLANTVLGVMINCMFGGPTYLTRMLPVAKLNTEFLAEQINETIISIKTAEGQFTHLSVVTTEQIKSSLKVSPLH